RPLRDRRPRRAHVQPRRLARHLRPAREPGAGARVELAAGAARPARGHDAALRPPVGGARRRLGAARGRPGPSLPPRRTARSSGATDGVVTSSVAEVRLYNERAPTDEAGGRGPEAGGTEDAAGSCTVTRRPPSARGASVSAPPCACAMLLTIASPRPTPAWSR